MPGFPPNPQFFELRHFGTLDTKASRDAIKDTDFSWIENLIPIGGGNLRALPGPSAPIFTATNPRTITTFFPFNIGANFFHFVVLDDGSAKAIAIPGGGSTTVAAATTFTNPSVAQWGSQFLLIVDPTKGYFIWDGTTLFIPGGAAPALFGGTMPTGINGTDITTFQNRVWIINGQALTFSAPGNAANFAGASGGGTVNNTDSTLRAAYISLLPASGFLYLIGDSSVTVINNVVTVSNVTTFNQSNVDPQSGTSWRDSSVIFGRAIMFANPQGVYALYGGAAQKVSAPLDGLLAGVTSALSPSPSSGLATVFGVKIFSILFKVSDFQNVTRPLLVCWDGKNWFIASQNNNNIVALRTLIQNSVASLWANDSTTIFQCFTTPTANITKQFQSKLVDGGNIAQTKELMRFGVDAKNNSSDALTFTINFDTDTTSTSLVIGGSGGGIGSITFVNNLNGTLQFQNNGFGNLIFTVGAIGPGSGVLTFTDIEWSGKLIGLSFTATNLDFTLVNLHLMYISTAAY